MPRRFSNQPITFTVIAAVHAIVLLAVLPVVSHNFRTLYNQDCFVDGYDQLAANLANGHGYRFYEDTAATLLREPGYPLFVAGLFLTFGTSFTVIKLANIVFALGTAWILLRISSRIFANPMVAVLPPLLFLIHPATLAAESRGGVEILFTFLMTLFVLLLQDAMRTERIWHYLWAGAVLGFAALVRSTPLLFPLFLLICLAVFDRRKYLTAKMCWNTAILVVAMLGVLAPWIVRNYRVTGHFVPSASVLGVSLHAGQYICTHRFGPKSAAMLDRDAAKARSVLASQQGLEFKDDYYQIFYSSADELRFSSYLTHRVMSEYMKHPLTCMGCFAYNLFNFWCGGKSWRATALNVLIQTPYLFSAILGLFVCIKRKTLSHIAPMLVFIVYSIAVSVPILAQARYSVPLLPFIAILGTIGLCHVRRADPFTAAAPEAVSAAKSGDTQRRA